MRLNQKGFGHAVLLIVLVVVAAIGFAAYRVYNSPTKVTAPPAPSKTAKAVNSGASVNQTTLTSASTELDQMGSQLDANLDDSALNVDLNSL